MVAGIESILIYLLCKLRSCNGRGGVWAQKNFSFLFFFIRDNFYLWETRNLLKILISYSCGAYFVVLQLP